MPGFSIDAAGFRTKASGSDTFKFVKPLDLHRNTATQEKASYSCRTFAGCPQAIRVGLRAPGFEMYCPYGLQLKVASLTAPKLTVKGATYGEGTPAPAVPWVLVTFSDKQPPVLLSFLDAPPETIVEGSVGDWKLKTVTLYQGWIRVSLPFGLEASSANSVSTLGEMAQAVDKLEPLFTQPAPEVVAKTYDSNETSLTVRWRFDRAGALVPPSAILAKAGGYKIKTLTPVIDSGKGTEEGPIVFCKGTDLALQFPLNRIPTGRSLNLGDAVYQPPNTMPASLSSTVELALANLVGSRSKAVVSSSEAALEEYFSKTIYATEPLSRSKLPFSASGEGMDLAAANALLMQALSMSEGNPQAPNSLMTSLSWRWDPMSMSLWSENAEVSRRAACLASLAAILDPEPTKRALGVMLQAGVTGSEVLPNYCRSRGFSEPRRDLPEPLFSIRSDVFGLAKDPNQHDSFVQSLSSEIRVVSDHCVRLQASGNDLIASWDYKPGDKSMLLLAVSSPVALERLENLTSLTSKESFGMLVVRFKAKQAGTCRIKLKRPDWSAPLPAAVPIPRYSESLPTSPR